MPYKDSTGQPAGYETMDDHGPLEPEDLYDDEVLNEPVENPVADAGMFPVDPEYLPNEQSPPAQMQQPNEAPGGGNMLDYQKMIHKMLMQRVAAKSRASEAFAQKNQATSDDGEY